MVGGIVKLDRLLAYTIVLQIQERFYKTCVAFQSLNFCKCNKDLVVHSFLIYLFSLFWTNSETRFYVKSLSKSNHYSE